MHRNPKIYIEEIYAVSNKIENFKNNYTYDSFLENEVIYETDQR
jgi:uncharacterized protein with HEPN domain